MKKIFFLATVLVATTVGIAQFSREEMKQPATTVRFERLNSVTVFNYQDTTKPQKDSLPPKKDSTTKF
jgi:hypothetical protein